MQPKFKHFVVTLFNLKLWTSDKTNSPTQTDQWLEERFQLFETYCLPSIRGQTCQDFTWLVLFDCDTPAPFRRRIEGYAKLVPQMKASFHTAQEAAEFLHPDEERNCRFIRKMVAALLGPDNRFVLTTNVDNDDAIHCRMLETLQRQFLASPGEYLYSLNLGLQYFPRWQAVLHMKYPHNHFLTLSESTGKDFRTVMAYGHTSARKRLPTIDLFGRDYWMEVVHGHNVSNELRITSRIRYSFCWKPFSLSDYGLGASPIPLRTNLLNNLVRLPAYFLRVAVWRIGRKLKRR